MNFWLQQYFLCLCFKVLGSDYSLSELMGIYYHKNANTFSKTCNFVSGLSFSKILFKTFSFKSHDEIRLPPFLTNVFYHITTDKNNLK